MKNKRNRSLFIIASVVIFAIAAGAYARDQTLFIRIADVLVCAIAQPSHTAAQILPQTRCATNDGNTITIIHKQTASTIEDTAIPAP